MKLGLPREPVCSYNLKRDMSLDIPVQWWWCLVLSSIKVPISAPCSKWWPVLALLSVFAQFHKNRLYGTRNDTLTRELYCSNNCEDLMHFSSLWNVNSELKLSRDNFCVFPSVLYFHKDKEQAQVIMMRQFAAWDPPNILILPAPADNRKCWELSTINSPQV